MTTKIVGVKEFRDNMTRYWKKARKENIRYIVMHRSTPVLEVNPLMGDNFVLEELAKEISKSRKEVAAGETYSHQEVCKMLGL
ncbi:MAG: hypothetical protein HOJ15_02935 [Candidatus Jacksonbacteria bacterium]|nr:hypothetical protein [Candidatus Jacksonbacteria bacterium]MBT6034159.1 hypothetical protein [Candidatus Jacksonbacteria bacterium]MBT6301352.1 hypothetical protein [Candidatus Jacksonbacteria bacterium]MBT6756726.1 hypothetical protein [Candidatus Jacksonbacteria bacterium]MBT6954994.1 hypothetical protein [Candidatus Jacksonbacteria bacterium]